MTISDRVFDKIRKIIYEKTGLVIGIRDRDKLARFLSSRDIRPKSLEEEIEYDRKLLYDIIDVVTVNETFFFRHESQFEVLEGILKDLLKRVTERKIRIWSVGCSTGEEPYSIAITACRAHFGLYGSYDCESRFEIIANDISREALNKAKEAVYGGYSIRNLSREVLETFFQQEAPESYRVKDFVRRLVTFYLFSVTSDYDVKRYIGFNSCDCVFCRNVMIYFDDNSRRKALDNIYDALRSDGFLFLAPTETIRDISGDRFAIAITMGGIIYVVKR
ncbi:MAG: CheR family methyltransferase [Thermosulfidibacteraceae bacterium]|jgi:chemotaxis protein methyltransferase CheR